MKKVLLTLLTGCLLCSAIFLVSGCGNGQPQQDSRRHVSMAIFDNTGKEWCILTEQENKQTIEITFDGIERTFSAELRPPEGDLPADSNTVSAELITSPSGENKPTESSASACEPGTYVYCFSISAESEQAYPFQAFLTVNIVEEEEEILPLPYGETKLSLRAHEQKYYSLPRGEDIYVLTCENPNLDLSIWDETFSAEFSLVVNGSEREFYNEGLDIPYVVRVYNESSETVSDELTLCKGASLAPGETVSVDIYFERYFYFTPVYDGHYEFISDDDEVDACIEEADYDGGLYTLSNDKTYIVKLTAMFDKTANISMRLHYEELVFGENILAGQIVKFTPNLSTFYTITFSQNIQKLIIDGEETEFSGKEYSAELIENRDYYFLLESFLGTGFDANVSIPHEELNLDETKSVSLDERGYAFYKIRLTGLRYYEIISEFEATVYNSYLHKVELSDNTFEADGIYYIRLQGAAHAEGSIQVKPTGKKIELGQSVLVSRNFCYLITLMPGKEYILTSSGNKFDTTQKIFAIYDGNGNQLATGEGITEIAFTAPTEKIYVKVSIEIEGRVISFRIDAAETVR